MTGSAWLIIITIVTWLDLTWLDFDLTGLDSLTSGWLDWIWLDSTEVGALPWSIALGKTGIDLGFSVDRQKTGIDQGFSGGTDQRWHRSRSGPRQQQQSPRKRIKGRGVVLMMVMMSHTTSVIGQMFHPVQWVCAVSDISARDLSSRTQPDWGFSFQQRVPF